MNPAIQGIRNALVSAIAESSRSRGLSVQSVSGSGDSATVLLSNGERFEWRVGNAIAHYLPNGQRQQIDLDELLDSLG